QRPAEREVLHLPDPVQRLVQARRLDGEDAWHDGGGSVPPGRPRAFRIIPPAVDTFIQLTVDALTLGSVYALIALGYTLVYGVLKLLNFAHGDVFMVGSFIGFGVLQLLGGTAKPVVPVWLLLVLMVFAAMVGCAV